jgi:hypothetical protein
MGSDDAKQPKVTKVRYRKHAPCDECAFSTRLRFVPFDDDPDDGVWLCAVCRELPEGEKRGDLKAAIAAAANVVIAEIRETNKLLLDAAKMMQAFLDATEPKANDAAPR